MMEETDVTTPDSFRFFRTFYEASKMIDGDKSRLRFYDAIIEYVFINKLPPFLDDESAEGRLLNMAWLLVKPVVDKSIGNSKGGRNSAGERPCMSGNNNAQNQQLNNSQSTVEQQSINSRTTVEQQSINRDKDKEKDKEKGIGIKEESTKKKRFDFLSELTLLGVSKQTASDFMEVRKQKKATNTQTAFNRIKSEINKAIAHGISAEDCIRMSVENSWQGFCYEWYQNKSTPTKHDPNPKNFTKTEYGTEQKKVITGPDLLRVYG